MYNKFVKYKNKIIFLLVFLSFILTACGRKELELVKENQFVLGTFGQIQIYSQSPQAGNKAITTAYKRIQEIENAMSATIKTSDIYRLNKNAGIEGVEVSEETLKVIEKGLEYYQLTNGTFNIGLGALSNLWGINIQSDKIPSTIPNKELVLKAKNHIDLGQLEINGREIFIRDSEMVIDLGGIAKGYAVDEAAKTLKSAGIENGFVNLGGDIYVLGPKPDGTPWRMGIQEPKYGSSKVVARLQLFKGSMVTSGDYQRFIFDEKTNKYYHHILDPKTGYPTDNELTSVTIIAHSAMEGDVFSTAAFVMGLEEGLAFVEELKNVEGIFITKDKIIYATSGIINEIEILDEDYKLFK